MNQAFRILAFILMAIFVMPSCGLAQMEIVSNIEEQIAGIEEIVVNGGVLEVSYEGSNQAHEVFLNAYLESNNRGHEITYTVEGNVLKVDLRKKGSGGWGNTKLKGFISLTGPENMNLNIKNSAGIMFISNVVSDKIDLMSSSGKIEGRMLNSDRIDVTASSGNIDLEGIHGQVNCKVSSGSGKISKVEGNVSLVASSGSYQITEVNGTVNGTMSSGSIRLEDIQELGNLKVSSGGIKAIRAGLGENTRFNGSSGSFSIQTDDSLEDYNYELSASSGTLQVGSNKAGKKLNLDNGSAITVSGATSSGSISIRN